ncbi:MAG: hypothetical protein ABIS17_10440 [Casimicrobiaceae bacterium]
MAEAHPDAKGNRGDASVRAILERHANHSETTVIGEFEESD